MVKHEVVDVLVLALLNFVDLDLHSEGELLLKQGQLVFVLADQHLLRLLK